MNMTMTPAEYREFCESTYSAPAHVDREEYLRLLLIEEVGEVASLFAKAMRDGHEVDRERLLKELGDVMWASTMLTDTGFLRAWRDMSWNTATYGFNSRLELFDLVLSNEFEPFYGAASLCGFLGFDPLEVALANVAKLRRRIADGTIHGAGSER